MWTFDATGEQYVTIRVDAFDPHTLDVYVTVYDEGGTTIGWDVGTYQLSLVRVSTD